MLISLAKQLCAGLVQHNLKPSLIMFNNPLIYVIVSVFLFTFLFSTIFMHSSNQTFYMLNILTFIINSELQPNLLNIWKKLAFQ